MSMCVQSSDDPSGMTRHTGRLVGRFARRPGRTVGPSSSSWTATTAVLALVAIVAVGLPAGAVGATPCWAPPVEGRVIDGFRAPPCPWCAGNRGIEYKTASTATVRSVASGTVTFSGVVAGTRYVVVELGNHWLVTYGRLASTSLGRGDAVGRRTIIGRATGEVFFGLRTGGEYRDPAPFLGQRVGRPRLVPTDGTRPRAAPEPRWRCAG